MKLLQYFGHFHPILLHLPIGFLLIAFAMELKDRWQQQTQFTAAISFTLYVSMFSAIIAAGTGYLLSLDGGYDADLLWKHQWLGIGVALLSILLVIFNRSKARRAFYFPTFIVTTIVLLGAGHFGGSLTHGSDFLAFNKTQASSKTAITDIQTAIVFQDIIQPIFKEKCVRCHNTSKTKGDLLMSTIAGIQKGGGTGAMLEAGKPKKSLFLQRIHLPLEAEEHMPPKGKKQLLAEEITLITWWVKEGASFDKRVSDLETPDTIQSILKKYIAPIDALQALNIRAVSEEVLTDLRQAGISVNRVGEQSPFVEVDLSRHKKVDRQLLGDLDAVADQITSLNLADSNIQDADLRILSSFPQLQKLYLQNTPITDKTLTYLREMPHLNYLNVYGTEISNTGLKELEKLPRLQKLYLWKTKTTSEGIAQLTALKPRLSVNTGVDRTLFGSASLKPPIITSPKDIFSDSLEILLDLNFKNVQIYYTTDGSNPDSTATLYTAPFTIQQTVMIKAIALKKGWQSSEVAQRQFVRATYTPSDISLDKPPHERYAANGAPSLIDFEKGSTTFTDGNWLGYEKSHFTAIIDLGAAKPVSGVTVSALEATGSYIFFPKGVKIALSKNGNSYKEVLSKTYATTQGPLPPELKNFTASFALEDARYVKVSVQSQLVNPAWHPAPGADCWVFVDEIVVE